MILMPVKTWAEFLELVRGKGLSPQYRDNGDSVDVFGQEGVFVWNIVILKASDDYTDFAANYAGMFNAPVLVQTRGRREIAALRLQGCRLEADADETGLISLVLLVPDTGTGFRGRVIDRGEAWITGEPHPDDRVLEVAVVAPDGLGGWDKVSGYSDDDCEHAGWWLPEKPGVLRLHALGDFGWLRGGLGLRVVAQCGGPGPFTGRKLKANIGWGKTDEI